ncbi:hypothetical protein HJG60_011078 [Phyllostomus discolor]|uniref:Uncharacterized protein n=1 Tax=Phyllostomus discolor TaxID=89673 RepID=A0A834A7M4_9CHIR|nr:hypothetical protein HJG60_011078 [Phyllostomus discolor]
MSPVRHGHRGAGGLSVGEPCGFTVVTSQLVWRRGWWRSLGFRATGTASHSSYCPAQPATWTRVSTCVHVCHVGAGAGVEPGVGGEPRLGLHVALAPLRAATHSLGPFPCADVSLSGTFTC